MPSKQGARTWARVTNIHHPRFSLPDVLASHPITHAVQLLIPGGLVQSGDMDEPPPLDLRSAACLASGSLGDLIRDLTCHGAWQRGGADDAGVLQPAVVAIGPQLGSTGGLAITPAGQLHLAVSAAMYPRLGLVGKRSTIRHGLGYEVTIDLTSPGCKPGRPFHDRVVSRLNEACGQACLAVAAADVGSKRPMPLPEHQQQKQSQQQQQQQQQQPAEHDQQATPSLPSLAGAHALHAWLPSCPQTAITNLPLHHAAWRVDDVALPALTRAAVVRGQPGAGEQQEPTLLDSASTPCGELGMSCLPQLVEWLGGLSCGFDGPAVNSLLPAALQPLASESKGCVRVQQWIGLLPQAAALQVVQHAVQAVASARHPWAAVGLWGWADSPIAWQGLSRSAGHSSGLPGDTTSQGWVLVLGAGDVLWVKALGAADVAV